MQKAFLKLSNRRLLCQLLCLCLFLFLFVKTDYSGQDEIPYAVNILFRLDPLLAACASIAARTIIPLMLPAVITLALTLILGRFVCGWICPLGTLLDLSHRLIPPRSQDGGATTVTFKYYLLAFLLVGSFFGLPLAGYFDPFSILVRGLALAVYPGTNALTSSFFSFTYQQAPDWTNSVTEPLYAALRQTVLPFQQNYFALAPLSLAILLMVFFLERLERRFFCRNICPLGGLLALASRFSWLTATTGSRCGNCRRCQTICRMGAIDEQKNISPMACNLCMDCVDLCPGNKISFGFGRRTVSPPTPALSRRTLLSCLAVGAVMPFILKTRVIAKQPDPTLIRPPGALPEADFLGRCVRCGECMKVCIGNALQPTFMAAGMEGMFTPRLIARIGYCEYNCTLCGQVCPTGAIAKLTIPQKQATKIGHAAFDKNFCLPYAKGIPCMVCEEHCPTPKKAIQFREAQVQTNNGTTITVKQPFLVDELCVGCGICETKCPLPGESAVKVTCAGESRSKAHRLPFQNNLMSVQGYQ